jgi:hypothetical protein
MGRELVNKTAIKSAIGALAMLTTVPAIAQTATLEQISRELAELKAKNERLEAEVEYLKESTKAERKEAAVEKVEVETLKTNAGKFTWNGDFRYRNEQITTAPNNATEESTQGRDRIRLRLGVVAKINDTVTGRFQIATNGGQGPGDPRSTNQTLGEGFSRKAVGIDLAYIDWKAANFLNVQLGKMPQPYVRSATFLSDGDITPEGAALRFARGPWFGSGYYYWLNERNSTAPTGLRSDTKQVGAQFGWKPTFGKATLTTAVGYYDLRHVRREIVSTVPIAGTPASTCVANGTFFNNSTNGNSTFDNNGATASGCTALLSDFNVLNGIVQLDFPIGNFPVSIVAEYAKNNNAQPNPTAGEELDTAFAAGVTFNRASNPKTWEVGVMYQQTEADSLFGQFHDSDFGAGRTDSSGVVFRGAFVPAANWTLNATYFVNELNNDLGAANVRDLDYKRLQLDLNFRF